MKNRMRMSAVVQLVSAGGRPYQEDAILVNREKGIFALADGFGGPQAGDTASKNACAAVLDFLQRESGDEDATFPFIRRSYYSLAGNVLFNSFVHANRQLLKANRGKAMQERGGASMVAGFVDGSTLSIASVGACSAWLLRAGRWAQLVLPRTFARMCDPFSVDATELGAIPMGALGMTDDLEPEMAEYFMTPGDAVLVHSDGILQRHRDQIAEVATRSGSIKEAGDRLKPALDSESANGQLFDNASFLLFQF